MYLPTCSLDVHHHTGKWNDDGSRTKVCAFSCGIFSLVATYTTVTWKSLNFGAISAHEEILMWKEYFLGKQKDMNVPHRDCYYL